METLTLLEHQQPVIDKLMEFIEENRFRANTTGFVVMPGGSGKTVIFSELVKRLNARAIILAPTLTILDQNLETMRKMSPDIRISTYCSGRKKDLTGDVVFTTYHSLARLLKSGKVTRDFARIVIFDEVHMSLSLKRSQIPEKLNALCIGFTATDKYSEQKNVERIFKNEIYRMSLREAIEAGILLPLRGFIIETNIDLQSVRISNRNQLDEKAAEKYLNILARNKVARDFYLQNFKGVPTVAFCVSIDHSIMLVKYFREAGIKVKAIHAGISAKERQKIFCDFKHGNLDVLCSCDILIQGWDSRKVTVELNLRPTYSWVLAEQRACRVVRTFKEKDCGIVVEFQDIYHRSDQPILIHHLFGERKYTQGGYVHAPKKLKRAEEQALETGQPVRIFKFGNLMVSSSIRKVVDLQPITYDLAFGDKNLIREILLSREDVDYRDLKMREFLVLNFSHPRFKGSGRQLIARYLGVLWRESAEDYKTFIYEILGDHFCELLSLIDVETNALTGNVYPDDELLKESFWKVWNTILHSLPYRDAEILSLSLGIGRPALSLDEIGERFNITGGRVREIKRGVINKIRHRCAGRALKEYLGHPHPEHWLN